MRALTLAWIGYALAILYASLIPFDLQPLAPAEALARLADIGWLTLTPGRRADWIANLLLYLPWAALGMAAWAPRLGTTRAALFVALAATLLALGIEALQVYFPPRTVSLNDPVAELLGTALGILLWTFAGHRLARLGARLRHPGAGAADAALGLFLLVYLGFVLFPFDLVLGVDEILDKAAAGRLGWLWAPVSDQGTVWALAHGLAEILTALPLGILLARHRRGPGTRAAAVVLGLTLGLAIELVQVLLVSGVSQGVSVLTRALGAGLGAWLVTALRGLDPATRAALPRHARRASLALLGPYLLLLVELQLGGLPTLDRWRTPEAILTDLQQLRFLPFYYHYYSSESGALVSLVLNLGLYGMAGVLLVPWTSDRWGAYTWGGWVAAIVGGGLAFAVEGLRLVMGLGVDPTNVWVGGGGAWIGWGVVRSRWVRDRWG